MKKLLFVFMFTLVLFSCEEKRASKMTLDDSPVVAHKTEHNGSEMTVCDLSLVKDTLRYAHYFHPVFL